MPDIIFPEHSDITLVFNNIQQDGQDLDFTTVSGWYFSMASGINTSSPDLALNSFTHSGLFTVNTGVRSVSVFLASSGLQSSGITDGQFFVGLWAWTTGNTYLTHRQRSIIIEKQIPRI